VQKHFLFSKVHEMSEGTAAIGKTPFGIATFGKTTFGKNQ
jgi:hypothetical protein